MEKKETALQVQKSESVMQIQKLSIDQLETATVLPIDFSSEYWTPVTPGESKRVLYGGVSSSHVPGNDNMDEKNLACAFFLVKEDGVTKRIRNGSRKLVGVLTDMNLVEGTALLITYKGKVKNKTNSYQSDDWSICPLNAAGNVLAEDLPF